MPYDELLQGHAESLMGRHGQITNGTTVFDHPFKWGPSGYLLALPFVFYFVCLVIEFIIPAGKYSLRVPPPPPPPAKLSESSSSTLSCSSTTEEDQMHDASEGEATSEPFSKNRGMNGIDIASALEHGTLRVHLLSAKGLKAGDSNGYSDPYVRLLFAGQRFKSKTVFKSKNPLWDETFEVFGVRGVLLKHNLQLRLFDWDATSADDKLGDASLDLEPLLHVQELSCQVGLSTQGQVSLRLSWVPQGQPAPHDLKKVSPPAKLGRALMSAVPGSDNKRASSTVANAQPKKGTGKMRVHLLRGEGLKAADRNGLSDPFVELALGGQMFTSKTITKTLNPRWNEVYSFEGVRNLLASMPLELRVYDRDPLLSGLRTARFGSARHDILGTATVDLTPMQSSSWKIYNVELTQGRSPKLRAGLNKVVSLRQKDLGSLHLMVSWEASGQAEMSALSQNITAAWDRFLQTAAKCVVGGFGPDPMAVPAEHVGKAWAARQYYMATWEGPREGECSEHSVSLGWLHQMAEEGHLPRELKVWSVEGGTAWATLESEMKKVQQAERKSVRTAKVSASEGGEEGAAAQTLQTAFRARKSRSKTTPRL